MAIRLACERSAQAPNDYSQQFYCVFGGETEKSLGDVLLPKGMVDDLWLWKQECPTLHPMPSFSRTPEISAEKILELAKK